jgi:hypothetical protein
MSADCVLLPLPMSLVPLGMGRCRRFQMVVPLV